jgi:FAD/FMN-containing dehydrogenase
MIGQPVGPRAADSRPARSWRALAQQINGIVLTTETAGYAARRRVGQRFGLVRPQAVVRCRSVRDVAVAIGFAKDNGLSVAVRSGGHDFAGRSTTDDLLIDLGDIAGVSVDDGHARIGPGGRTRAGTGVRTRTGTPPGA